MLQRVVTNDLSKAAVGEAQYNLVLNDGGGVVEDLIVYRLERGALLRGPERVERAARAPHRSRRRRPTTGCT